MPLFLVDGIMGDRSWEQALESVVPHRDILTPHAHDLPGQGFRGGYWPTCCISVLDEECLRRSSDLRVTLLLRATGDVSPCPRREWGFSPYICHADASFPLALELSGHFYSPFCVWTIVVDLG